MKKITEFDQNAIIVENPQLATSIYADTLTKSQLDIIMCVVSLINKNDDNFHTYEIPTSEVLKILRPGNPRTDEAKKKLQDTIIGLKKASFVIDNEEEMVTFGWIDFARLNKKNNTLTIRLSDEVKELYLNLKGSGLIYRLENILVLSTTLQAKLYEWAYSKKNFGNEIPISIDDIKTILGKQDIRTADFLSKYLDPAMKKINDKTDLQLSYKKVKSDKENKRKITSLKFKIECNYKKKEKNQRTPSQLKSDKEKRIQTWQENQALSQKCELLESIIEAQKETIQKITDANEMVKENNDLKLENLKLKMKIPKSV